MIRYCLLGLNILGMVYLAIPSSYDSQAISFFILNPERKLYAQTYFWCLLNFIDFLGLTFVLSTIDAKDLLKYKKFLKYYFLVHAYYMVEFFLNYSSFAFPIFGMNCSTHVLTTLVLCTVIISEDATASDLNFTGYVHFRLMQIGRYVSKSITSMGLYKTKI